MVDGTEGSQAERGEVTDPSQAKGAGLCSQASNTPYGPDGVISQKTPQALVHCLALCTASQSDCPGIAAAPGLEHKHSHKGPGPGWPGASAWGEQTTHVIWETT